MYSLRFIWLVLRLFLTTFSSYLCLKFLIFEYLFYLLNKTYKSSTELRTSDLQLSDGGEYVHSVIHVHLLDNVMDGDKQSAKGGTVTSNEEKKIRIENLDEGIYQEKERKRLHVVAIKIKAFRVFIIALVRERLQ